MLQTFAHFHRNVLFYIQKCKYTSVEIITFDTENEQVGDKEEEHNPITFVFCN